MATPNNISEAVKKTYGQAASRVSAGVAESCGISPSSDCCGGDPITGNLYELGQTADIPENALLASLGCGNPTALAQLRPGEIVLDLGSGGGIDVLLSAKRVSPGGRPVRVATTKAAAMGAALVWALTVWVLTVP